MRLLPFLRRLLWTALLIPCATGAAMPPVAHGAGYVDLQRLLRESPLSAELTRYDHAIVALEKAEALWNARARATEITESDAALIHDFQAASTQVQTVSTRASSFEKRERAALSRLTLLARSSHSASGPASFLRAQSNTAAEVRGAMVSDFDRDRANILEQERRAIAQTERAVARRVADAYSHRVNRLQEEESTLALQLVREDAYRTLLLRVRSSDVFHDQTDRRNAQRELAAIDLRETATLSARRATDRRRLAAYREELLVQASAERTKIETQIRNRMSANLAARLAIVDSQEAVRPPALPALPGTSQPVALAIGSLSKSSSAAISGQLSSTRNAFISDRAGLHARFVAVARLDAAAEITLRAQIATLRGERAILMHDLDGWIMDDAAIVARERGIARVSTRASRGTTNLTGAVAALMRRDESAPMP